MASGITLRSKHNGVILEQLAKKTGRARVLVGVLAGTGEHPKATGGQTVAQVAFWNEFGTTKAPPRPFLTTTIKAHGYYKSEFKSLLRQLLAGNDSPTRLLGLLGLRASNDVKVTITDIMDPENAPSTQAEKANKSHVNIELVNNPLIDSGTLRASINYEVRE